MRCRWEFKKQHWDSVMLFKMGKFYELFEMDAHTGCEVLGLSYMRVSLSLGSPRRDEHTLVNHVPIPGQPGSKDGK